MSILVLLSARSSTWSTSPASLSMSSSNPWGECCQKAFQDRVGPEAPREHQGEEHPPSQLSEGRPQPRSLRAASQNRGRRR
eukprot:14882932-Alexandrium_andersonii.AAC.1